MVPKQMTPQRQTAMEKILVFAAQAGAAGVTRSEVANAVGLASTWTAILLDDMIETQHLVKVWDESLYPGRYRFYLSQVEAVGNV